MGDDITLELARFANELAVVKTLSVLTFVLGCALVLAMLAMIRNNKRDDNRLENVLRSNMRLNMALVKALTSGLRDVHASISTLQQINAVLHEKISAIAAEREANEK